jgi:hypothetical protein
VCAADTFSARSCSGHCWAGRLPAGTQFLWKGGRI